MQNVKDGQTLRVRGDATLIVGKGAKATIVIEPEGPARIAIHAREKSDVRCYMICRGGAAYAQSNHVGPGATLRNASLWLGGSRAKVTSMLEGTGAEARDVHAFIARGDSEFLLDSALIHKARGTRGDILIKGVVDGSASARLGGMIRILKSGAGAESFLAEHALLLGQDARASANPELEISNNDVSSRHAASVSQIDESKLFYLMSRGLRRDDAVALFVEGFLNSAIGRIEDEGWCGLMMENAAKALRRR